MKCWHGVTFSTFCIMTGRAVIVISKPYEVRKIDIYTSNLRYEFILKRSFFFDAACGATWRPRSAVSCSCHVVVFANLMPGCQSGSHVLGFYFFFFF